MRFLRAYGALAFLGLGVGLSLLVRGADVESFSVPLTQTNGWQFLSFRKIPTNVFRATPAGLEIGVTNSAAPAVYPLASPVDVTTLIVHGKIAGSLKVSGKQQGEKGFDDYAVRIGVVESGKRTLNWGERLIAADWVKRLFSLAPPGAGINRIHFFNVGVNGSPVGRNRVHPLSDLMEETIVAVPDTNGNFAFTNRFANPLKVVAIWISCDGDDTKSSFRVVLDKVELGKRAEP